MPRYIHYFNPENDLALASGDAHYTPPASARQMARDLQSLPRLWAKAGDWVLLIDPPPALPQRKGAVTFDGERIPWAQDSTPSLEGRAGGVYGGRAYLPPPMGLEPLGRPSAAGARRAVRPAPIVR